MLPSPAKRRKIDAAVPSQAHEIPESSDATRQPTTPTRASYRSPTKSSLARSHPHLVPRSTRRSATTESRGKGLRDEILGTKATVSVAEPPAAPNHSLDRAGERPTSSQSDENDVRRPQSHEATAETGATGARQSPPKQRRPLTEHRQPMPNGEIRRRGVGDETLGDDILPTLVARKDPSATTRTRHGSSDQEELPPTPVELGLTPIPERPRGLASSSSPRGSRVGSSAGSKSSSGSRRRRIRLGGMPVTSSPLKPKNRPYTVDVAAEAPESVHNDVQEAPESEAEGEGETTLSPEDREKQDTLQGLRETLQQLREQISELEKAVESEKDLGEEQLSALLESALIDDNGLPIDTIKATHLGDDAWAYLTLFSPGNLQLSSRSEARMLRGRPKVFHELTVSAPTPWLPNVFSAIFEVAVDTQDMRIEHVQIKDAPSDGRRTKSTKAEIFNWINGRLGHPLHRFNVGGLIWGMGQWFNAAVERAKVFRRLDSIHSKSHPSYNDDESGDLTQAEAVGLARYLDMTQLETFHTVPGSGKKASKRTVMLMWAISLGWTGEPTSTIQIATSGIPVRAVPELKTVFNSLLPTKGPLGAFESVWALVLGGEDEAITSAGGPRNGKRRA